MPVCSDHKSSQVSSAHTIIDSRKPIAWGSSKRKGEQVIISLLLLCKQDLLISGRQTHTYRRMH